MRRFMLITIGILMGTILLKEQSLLYVAKQTQYQHQKLEFGVKGGQGEATVSGANETKAQKGKPENPQGRN